MNKLEKTLGFNEIRNECSNIAYNIIKDIKTKQRKFNENHLNETDLRFELENYFYNGDNYPQINLKENLSDYKDILEENGFVEKFIELEGRKEYYYENVKNSDIKIKNNTIFIERSYQNKLDKVFNEGLFGFGGRGKYEQRYRQFDQLFSSHNLQAYNFFDLFHDSFVQAFTKIVDSLESNEKFRLRNNMNINDFIIRYLIENNAKLKALSGGCTLIYTEIPIGNFYIPAYALYKQNKKKQLEFVCLQAFGTVNIEDKLYIIPFEMYSNERSLEIFEVVKNIRKKWNCVYFE